MDAVRHGRIKIAAGVGIGAAAGFMAWAVRGRSSNVFGPSIWRGSRERRSLALTFDDGPSESTPAILDVLGRYGVPATFFQIGANVARLPEIARAVRDAGHAIGNHTYHHRMFCFRGQSFLEQELRKAQEIIEVETGRSPLWFRAPYGVRWFGLRHVLNRLGLGAVMWTVIGYDWKRPASAVVNRVAAGASNGAILCLHDGRELGRNPDIRPTLEAVQHLVPMLLDQGFRFESLEQLLCPTN